MTTEAEARLEAALKADAAPARDPVFRIEIMLRHENAVFRRRLATTAALTLGGALAAALGLAALGRLSGAGALPATLAATLAALAGALAARYSGSLAGLWRWLPGWTLPTALMPRLWR